MCVTGKKEFKPLRLGTKLGDFTIGLWLEGARQIFEEQMFHPSRPEREVTTLDARRRVREGRYFCASISTGCPYLLGGVDEPRLIIVPSDAILQWRGKPMAEVDADGYCSICGHKVGDE